MKINIWTWGTGGAFGKEVGLLHPGRSTRHHTSTSIIGELVNDLKFHFLIDTGAPCVETMIGKNVKRIPDVLLITHPHVDHVSDLDKLVNSRKRSFKLLRKDFVPLPIICTNECLEDPKNGLKAKFYYLKDLVKWTIIPVYDLWYSIRKPDGKLIPSNMITQQAIFPIEFKSLPVYHAPHSLGSCLFIFRIKGLSKKIVISGDFESIEDSIIENPDLKDPALLLLDTNTIKAVGTNHTNWEQNKKLISCWITGCSKVLVLLNHISGFEDYDQGYYDHIPTDDDWKNEIRNFASPPNTTIKIAEDGKRYSI